MFERFTDRARRAVVLAQDEARLLSHNYVGCEHIMLGLMREGNGLAASALASLGVTYVSVREQILELVGEGQVQMLGHIPFTPEAKKLLQLSLREAMQLGHNYIGTEHILLGLLRDGDNAAVQALVRLGIDLSQVRQAVIGRVRSRPAQDQSWASRAAARLGRDGGKRGLLTDILAHIEVMDARLAAIERRVGVGPDTRDLDRDLTRIRQQKQTAIEAQDFEQAARLRDREDQLLAERDASQADWAAVHRDVPSLTAEIESLRELLRRHGIEPHDGAA
jgi:ATP-dependent Clp protease ATP-binding subunit ClpA